MTITFITNPIAIVELTPDEDDALKRWYGEFLPSFTPDEYDDEISTLYGPHYPEYAESAHAAAQALESAYARAQ